MTKVQKYFNGRFFKNKKLFLRTTKIVVSNQFIKGSMNLLHWNIRGYCCADKLAALGHSIVGEDWFLFLGTDVGYRIIDSLNLFLGCLYVFSVSFPVFCCFFFVGFGIVLPLFVNIFFPFFNKFLSLAAHDGGISGCQPSWDVDDAFWCLSSLLA